MISLMRPEPTLFLAASLTLYHVPQRRLSSLKERSLELMNTSLHSSVLSTEYCSTNPAGAQHSFCQWSQWSSWSCNVWTPGGDSELGMDAVSTGFASSYTNSTCFQMQLTSRVWNWQKKNHLRSNVCFKNNCKEWTSGPVGRVPLIELPPLSPGIQARVMEEVEVVETVRRGWSGGTEHANRNTLSQCSDSMEPPSTSKSKKTASSYLAPPDSQWWCQSPGC